MRLYKILLRFYYEGKVGSLVAISAMPPAAILATYFKSAI